MAYIPELGGYVPVLSKSLETSITGIYAAGDLACIEEASVAMLEGALAGLAAARSLGHEEGAGEDMESVREELTKLRQGPGSEKIRVGLAKMHREQEVGQGA